MSVSSTARRVVPFNDHARIEALDAEPGTGRTRIADLHELTNHIGTVHGGALFTVGEAASGRALFSGLFAALGESGLQLIPVVKTATIQFLKVAKGEINAVGKMVTPVQQVVAAIQESGRSIANVEVALTNVEGVTVATMQVEWHIRLPKQ